MIERAEANVTGAIWRHSLWLKPCAGAFLPTVSRVPVARGGGQKAEALLRDTGVDQESI